MDKTILFVDDEEETLRALKRLLRKEPYKQLFASSGKEALELMSKQYINVIVTDLLMPEMNGLQLLSIIKEKYPDTVRIILSGHAQVPTILSAINNGNIFRFITKPWKVDEDALSIINEALEYSSYIKKKNGYISLDLLKQLLDKIKHKYIIVDNRNVVTAIGGDIEEKIEVGSTVDLSENPQYSKQKLPQGSIFVELP